MPKLIRTKVENEGQTAEEWAFVETPRTTPWDVEQDLDVVGKPTPRVDGAERASGAATYTVDIRLPRMLHAKFLRSPYPHARILRVDSSAAEQLPGVRAVLHSGNSPALPFRRNRNLFSDTVRFVGDEVAVVAADSEAIARRACQLIQVEYEPLPYVLDPEIAASADAPALTDNGNLVDGEPETYERGDVARGFAEAQVVVEGVFKTPAQVHNPLEPHATVAHWDGKTLTVWDSTQNVSGVQSDLASIFGLELNRVRVISHFVGGAFGSKLSAHKQAVAAATLSRMLGRAVRCVLDRHEENLAGGNRAPTKQYLRIGARKDGRLTAIELNCYCSIGAYGSWGGYVAGPVRELYACPNVRTATYNVLTNTPPFAAFRAPGFVEGTFALESLMDELAVKLGIDPLELRRLNYSPVFPETGMPYSSNGLLDAYEEGARAIDWSRRSRPPERRGAWRIGVGMASQIWFGAGAPPSYAMIKVNRDASVTIITASQDLGTGTKTILCQIASEELGIPLERIRVELGDTEAGVYAGSSGGSMTAASVGPAVREAAADAREQLLSLAAVYLRKRIRNLALRNGHVIAGRTATPLADILGELGDIQVIGRGSRNPHTGEYVIRTFGAQFAQVAVDIETGEVRVERVVAAHDSGRILNPLTASNQVEGGVLQGMAFALMEGRVLDEGGNILNANLERYHLPTIMDAPEITVRLIDRADSLANNLGVKGIGEPPIIPTAAAIANAIRHATGIRFNELPLTRDKVINALYAGVTRSASAEQSE